MLQLSKLKPLKIRIGDVEDIEDLDEFELELDGLSEDLAEDEAPPQKEAEKSEAAPEAVPSGEESAKVEDVKSEPELPFEVEETLGFEEDALEDDDEDLSLMAEADETSTKLDLARAYIDMGDSEGAKDILDEILLEGDEVQQQEAKDLLDKVGG